jgi:aarF domain-containing kinase
MQRFRLKRDHWKHLRIHLPPEASRNSGLRLRWHSKLSSSHQQWRPNPWIIYPTTLLLISGAGLVAYGKFQPFRHIVLASVRCSRVAGWFCVSNCVDHTERSRFMIQGAAILGAIDYKRTFAQTFESEDDRLMAYSACHKRSAERVLRALLANGGVLKALGKSNLC